MAFVKWWSITLVLACFGAASLSVLAESESVNGERAVHANDEPGQWMLHGRTYDEQRFSPLTQINAENVGKLGVAWYADIASPDGLVSTPIVVDGVIYLSGSLARVFAVDAATGRMLWQFDPKIRLDMGFSNSWSARINRGVAVWKGKVFVGTGDCRLIAIDADSGSKIWETLTCDPLDGYGITGAPRAFKDKVVIGNLGGDTATRGYITAYDTETGKQVWRFYTTPGNPAKGFENKAMEMAAKTWKGEGWWEGSGGNAWDAIVYDPELNQVYVGTDGSIPKDPSIRSPGGGDNLFTNSIVAIDADTGTYKWHYQTVPRDAWDYNSTNHIILAELQLDGVNRKVLMQAPKNGFFYVLDRTSGALLRAQKYAKVTWAERVDLKTGRPVVAESAKYYENATGRAEVYPHPIGGHSWQPMSFSPLTKLVYIPAHDFPVTYDAKIPNLEWSEYAIDPTNAKALKGVGHLLAWDPDKQEARWNVEHDLPLNSGILSTAGNLVFQGTATARLNAYAADDGHLLWSHPAAASVQAAPVTYMLNGEQYILAPVGIGGQARLMFALYGASADALGPSRLIAFKLGGTAALPEDGPEWSRMAQVPKPPDTPTSPELVKRGERLFLDGTCLGCHGIWAIGAPGSSAPDLRYLTPEKHQRWNAVVLGGALNHNGMSGYGSQLTLEDAEALHAYVIYKQRILYDQQQGKSEKH